MSEWEDWRNITIPISTAVIARAIHSILSAAVDIGIVIFRQSSHSDMLLTPTVFSFLLVVILHLKSAENDF